MIETVRPDRSLPPPPVGQGCPEPGSPAVEGGRPRRDDDVAGNDADWRVAELTRAKRGNPGDVDAGAPMAGAASVAPPLSGFSANPFGVLPSCARTSALSSVKGTGFYAETLLTRQSFCPRGELQPGMGAPSRSTLRHGVPRPIAMVTFTSVDRSISPTQGECGTRGWMQAARARACPERNPREVATRRHFPWIYIPPRTWSSVKTSPSIRT